MFSFILLNNLFGEFEVDVIKPFSTQYLAVDSYRLLCILMLEIFRCSALERLIIRLHFVINEKDKCETVP